MNNRCSIFSIAIPLLIVCLVSLLLYLTIPFPAGHYEIDSREYDCVAKNYMTTGRFDLPEEPGKMTPHTIGYHMFVTLLYQVSHASLSFLIAVQIILALFCCLMIYALARRIFDQTTAHIALAFSVCNVGFVTYAQLIISEILLLTFLILFLYTFIVFVQTQKRLFLLISALMLGCSVIIKPVGLFFPLLLVPFLWWSQRSNTLTHKTNAVMLFIFIFSIPVLGYMSYNRYRFNTFTLTTLMRENLYLYFLPRRIIPQLNEAERRHFTQKIERCPQQQFLAVNSEIFFELLQRHPLLFGFAWTESLVKIACGLYSTQLKTMFNPSLQGGLCSFSNMHGSFLERIHAYINCGATTLWLNIVAYAEACWLVLEYFLVIIACIVVLRRKELFWLLFLLSYIAYFALVAGHDGCGRYRLILEPGLLVLAAQGVRLLLIVAYNTRRRLIPVVG